MQTKRKEWLRGPVRQSDSQTVSVKSKRNLVLYFSSYFLTKLGFLPVQENLVLSGNSN